MSNDAGTPRESDTMPRSGRWPITLAAAVAALGVLVLASWLRGSINLAGALPPGMDAAYYPLQARTLLERGRLMYQDMPLTFALHAAIGKAWSALAGVGLDDALLATARWFDTLVPPVAGALLVAMVWRWSAPRVHGLARASALAAGVGVGLLAAASWPTLRMTGDFQKNSFGLVWCVACAWALTSALARVGEPGAVRRWLIVGLTALLAALTHVAAAGVAALIAAVALPVWAIWSSRLTLRRAAWSLAAVLVLAGALLALVFVASPRRAEALAAAPIRLFQGSGGAGAMGPPGMPGHPGSAPSLVRWPVEPAGRVALVGAVCAAALALGVLLIRRRDAHPARAGLMVGASACALLVTCPLLHPEYAQRLNLIAPIPTALALAAAFAELLNARSPRAAPIFVSAAGLIVGAASLATGLIAASHWSPRLPEWLAAGPVGFGGLGGPRGPGGRGPGGAGPVGGMAIITPDAADELRALRPEIGTDFRTLIVARHGLEWWAGFLLNAPVREGSMPDDAWQRYDRVWFLQESRGATRPRPSTDSRDLLDDEIDRMMGLGPPPDMRDDDRPPPGPDGPGLGPPRRGPMGRPGGPGGMMSIRTPEGAQLIHEGEHYRVYELRRPAP